VGRLRTTVRRGQGHWHHDGDGSDDGDGEVSPWSPWHSPDPGTTGKVWWAKHWSALAARNTLRSPAMLI
jgi:hypothetical protein